ncbi:hypothetical protein FXO38_10924, partial [Capsicum annuum]
MKAAGAIRVFELLNCISNMSTSGDKCLVSKIASSNIPIIYSVTKLVMFAESLVAFTDAERLIGEVEKNQAALNPERPKEQLYALLQEIHGLLRQGVSADKIFTQLSPWASALFKFLSHFIRKQLLLHPESDDSAQ